MHRCSWLRLQAQQSVVKGNACLVKDDGKSAEFHYATYSYGKTTELGLSACVYIQDLHSWKGIKVGYIC